MSFVANFIGFQQCKKCENQLRFDKVTESLKEGTFLRHSVLAVPILALLSSSACDSQLACQILSKWDHRRPSYDVIANSGMAAETSQIYFRFPLR